MRRLGLALTCVAALALSACGSGGIGDGEASSSSSTTADVSTTEAAATTTTVPPTTAAPTTAAPTTTLFAAPEVSTIAALLALDRPVIAGHAGGDQDYPHSTMFAFREAARAGVDVLEMDVQLTADGVLVVQHDATVDRTTEATGAVRELTLVEIQALDNAYWWSEDWSNHDLAVDAYTWRGVRTGAVNPPTGYTADDFRVETFRAIAEAFPDHVLDIEIKVPADAFGGDDIEFAIDGAFALAEEIEALDRHESVIVVSFNTEVIVAFRDVAPDVATSPSVDEMLSWYLGGGELTPQDLVAQVPPDFDGIEVLVPAIVDRVHEAGLDIWVWPNDVDAQENGEYYVEVISLGADGIIAGRPADAVAAYAAAGLVG